MNEHLRPQELSHYEMPFGKHRGERLGDIPASYLLWLHDQSFCPNKVRNYVERERKHLTEEAANEGRGASGGGGEP
jgi:uncharacterized protein (DUF3820 family)